MVSLLLDYGVILIAAGVAGLIIGAFLWDKRVGSQTFDGDELMERYLELERLRVKKRTRTHKRG